MNLDNSVPNSILISIQEKTTNKDINSVVKSNKALYFMKNLDKIRFRTFYELLQIFLFIIYCMS